MLSLPRARVQSLVGELGSRKLCGAAKGEKKRKSSSFSLIYSGIQLFIYISKFSGVFVDYNPLLSLFIKSFILSQNRPLRTSSSWLLHHFDIWGLFLSVSDFLTPLDVPSSSSTFLPCPWSQPFLLRATAPFRGEWYTQTLDTRYCPLLQGLLHRGPLVDRCMHTHTNVLFLAPFYKLGKWGTEKLSNLSKVTKLICNRTGKSKNNRSTAKTNKWKLLLYTCKSAESNKTNIPA